MSDESDGRLIAAPVTEIAIDVLPATPQNLAAFCERFERRLEAKRFNWDELVWLHNTRHPALAALAWRIMERYPSGRFCWALFDLTGKYSESAEVAEAHFLKLADDSHFKSRGLLFSYWGDWGGDIPFFARAFMSGAGYKFLEDSDNRKPLSPAAFAALVRSERLWTRVLTYVHFGKRCDKPWIENLFRELKDQQQPIPANCFNFLLREMDSESFAAREKAMAQLRNYGERAEAQLKQSLQAPLSLEVKHRVCRLLEGIESAKASPEWKPIIEHLKAMGRGQEADAVLDALCKGAPEAALTKAATAAMQERARLYPNER